MLKSLYGLTTPLHCTVSFADGLKSTRKKKLLKLKILCEENYNEETV